MPYELSDEERDGVMAAPDEKRYRYLVSKCADWGEVWVLSLDGDRWASLEDGGQKYLPIWPHPGFAEGSLKGNWEKATPKPVEVHEFLTVLGNLGDLGDGVAMFQTADGDFISVAPEPLASDLRAELDRIE